MERPLINHVCDRGNECIDHFNAATFLPEDDPWRMAATRETTHKSVRSARVCDQDETIQGTALVRQSITFITIFALFTLPYVKRATIRRTLHIILPARNGEQ